MKNKTRTCAECMRDGETCSVYANSNKRKSRKSIKAIIHNSTSARPGARAYCVFGVNIPLNFMGSKYMT